MNGSFIQFICFNFYIGETPLHAAIANQNPELVRILLSKRANVHARCIGTMFGPQDQKFNRKDIESDQFMSKKSNHIDFLDIN